MPIIPNNTSSSDYVYDPTTGQSVVTSTTWQVSFWLFDLTRPHYVLYTDGTPPLSINYSPSAMQINDSVNAVNGTVTLTTGWTHFVITNVAGVVTMTQDGTALSTNVATLIPTVFGASNITLFRGGAIAYDLRIKDGTADVAAWTYYRNDVLNGGDITSFPA